MNKTDLKKLIREVIEESDPSTERVSVEKNKTGVFQQTVNGKIHVTNLLDQPVTMVLAARNGKIHIQIRKNYGNMPLDKSQQAPERKVYAKAEVPDGKVYEGKK